MAGIPSQIAKAVADAREMAYEAKKSGSEYAEIKAASVETELTDIEIAQMEQEQMITDHDIAIMELQEALEN